MTFFSTDTKTALQAKGYAQWIAFAPMVFQAARSLRNFDILSTIHKAGKGGISIEDVCEKLKFPYYGARVLMEAGLGIGLLIVNDDKYTLTNTGYIILTDKLTRVNLDFSHDVCYEGLFNLDKSIETGKPEGLKVFGKWKTVYEALAHLEPHVQKSWFAFDHYYSDDSFPQILPHVYKNKPKQLLDIGGNTGKWAIASAEFDNDVHVTIMDLPGQTDMAKKNIDNLGLSNRVSFFQTNILDESLPFPKGFDAIWMSQFLDCFSDAEIISILTRCHNALNNDGAIYILEPFWDNQRFEAAAFSLQMTSLYFTAIANGNSQMYNSKIFIKLIEKSGFVVDEIIPSIGISHTLVKCKKKQ
ncbi:MAG: class I SAM-dependent methyltransferase [Bacteroidia bacterium]